MKVAYKKIRNGDHWIVYAIAVDGLDPGFLANPSVRHQEEWEKLAAFQYESLKDWLGTKGRNVRTELRRWIRAVNPTQIYARWREENDGTGDHSVHIFYAPKTH